MAFEIIKSLVPSYLKDSIRIKRLNRRFRNNNCRICSAAVSYSAQLGQNVYIAKGVNIRDNVSINDESYCSSGTIVFNNTDIGKYCSIGYNVQIGCPEHPTHFFSTSPSIYRDKEIKKYCPWPSDDYKEKVVIGNDVWIGSNSLILQGVHIGNGAIIAAGSVVTKDIPPYAVWGGDRQSKLKSVKLKQTA